MFFLQLRITNPQPSNLLITATTAAAKAITAVEAVTVTATARKLCVPVKVSLQVKDPND